MNHFCQYPLFIGWLLGVNEGGDDSIRIYATLFGLAHNLALYSTFRLAVKKGRREEVRRRELKQADLSAN